MLEVRGLTKRFNGLTAIRDVDLAVSRGDILGILGPNGAGKTTLFNMLSGTFPSTAGEIVFEGVPLQRKRSDEIARLGIGRTFQIVRPFNALTVLENVLAGLGARHNENVLRAINRYRKEPHLTQARAWLAMTDLAAQENEIAENLPLGLLRRLEIARALALSPKLLLLDESFSGLSHLEARSLGALVHRLRENGMTILLIEHNTRVAMSLCDRIVVLDRGQKIAEGTADEIRANPAVIAAYLGDTYA